ncbi:MAG: deoxyribodipyrimidine photo-lyase/cryptochrome family protein [Verrucomicrobiota bacterium]
MTHIVWFKKDLRLTDHFVLKEAIEASYEKAHDLILLYLYEDSIIAGEDVSRRHLLFINECLKELSDQLAKLGQKLLIVRGEVIDIFSDIHSKNTIHSLWSHEETGNALTYERDKKVSKWCKAHNVKWNEMPQHGVIRCLKNRNGWAAQWAKRMNRETLAIPEFPSKHHKQFSLKCASIIAPEIFSKNSLGEQNLQRGGAMEAHRLIESFLGQRGKDYTKAMSSPVTAFDACSRLSPYLTYGAMSVREAYHIGKHRQKVLKEATANSIDMDKKTLSSWRSALRSFMGRLRWHCHFMQKLEDEPELEWRNLFQACDGLREDEWNDDYYQAWASGQTGYPMVDACMRALIATGWINFRMRAMLMSFSSYHLWLHWRQPGLHLARLFTDYEPGIHWSQVQMQSGTTGINSIRVYSPTKQAMDQDPNGLFIRQWIPELKAIPDKYLHEPWKTPELEQRMCGCVIGEDYPDPIVEHSSAYKDAQRKIRSVRKNDNKLERQKIYQRHGSRRRPGDAQKRVATT